MVGTYNACLLRGLRNKTLFFNADYKLAAFHRRLAKIWTLWLASTIWLACEGGCPNPLHWVQETLLFTNKLEKQEGTKTV